MREYKDIQSEFSVVCMKLGEAEFHKMNNEESIKQFRKKLNELNEEAKLTLEKEMKVKDAS